MDRSNSHTSMVPTKSRPRSNTATSVKSRKRAQSRASTTSDHSNVTQLIGDQQLEDATQYDQYHHDGTERRYGSHRFVSADQQTMAEDMTVHGDGQLQASNELEIDPALGASVNPLSYVAQFQAQNPRHSLPAEPYGTGFGEEDSQMLDTRSDEQDDVESMVGANAGLKKAAKASAANEMEMRQLFNSNKHRSLPEIARELHGNERGPQSERTRQVFAMLWIDLVCDKGKGSVPRGRVYSNYVSRCATERVTVLNPASFGKLVRVLFPGLKTRRLGVRGESKYHYVNFTMKEEHHPQQRLEMAQIDASNQHHTQNFNDPPQLSQTFNISHNNIDRAIFPSPGPSLSHKRTPDRAHSLLVPHSLYSQPEVGNISQIETTRSKVPKKMKFNQSGESAFHEYEPINLPSIEPYLPAGTDVDSASALVALYRSHCTSLIECIRFCKEKTFFHLFTSFHGTLTMPVQKLFAHPSIAPWIEECDFIMYQKMMHVVAPLTLQVVPKPVIDTIRNISERLVRHIQTSFQGQPSHVIEAKVTPATLFAALLDREHRVNLTAHAAANMLSNPANRDQMYEDWITMVRTRKVAECVPTRAMDDLVNLLLTQLRHLLDPVQISWDIEGATPYGQMSQGPEAFQQGNIHTDATTENVLDRWVSFLNALPERFPYASSAEIVWGVTEVGTAVMRDLTLSQGKSFGAWWVTKCWIDEMICFMAEQGGFMEYKSSRDSVTRQASSRRQSGLESRYSSGSEVFDFNKDVESGTSNTILIPRPMDATSQNAMNAAAGHDDSGISIRASDDDFPAGKYGFLNESIGGSVDDQLQQSLTS